MDIILASASPRRKELMQLITQDFTVVVSAVEESALKADTPKALAQLLAIEKCKAVAQDYPASVVIGCDTVVDVDGEVFGKPENTQEAERMLQQLSGRNHLVHTGVCMEIDGKQTTFTETTKVFFHPITKQELKQYLSTQEPYDKAGAYGIQGAAAKFVAGIEGCYFNVVGLPVSAIYQTLQKLSEDKS